MDYSYKILLSDNTSLRFGLKGGFTNYSNPLTEYVQNDPLDAVFQGMVENKFMPNVGVGLFLSSKVYYLSLSLPKIIENSYQKMSLVRYNPFADTGGDLSFSLALLDLTDTGFVITGIHGRGVDRIYAKEIIKGKSKHNLSEEEIAAIRKAHDEK